MPTLRLILTVVLLGTTYVLAQGAPPVEPDLKIEAWLGAGKHGMKPTRVLADLSDFKPGDISLDQYGGWISGKPARATGFFRAEQIDGRWWLITPNGNRFLHLAVNAVTHPRRPAPGWPFAAENEWRDRALELLFDLGFNGSGAWSRDQSLNAPGRRRLVYTPNLDFMTAYGWRRGGVHQQPGHAGFPNDVPFIFDPAFPVFCDEHAKKLDAARNDPYLLGYFTDNELPWKRDALDRYLALPATDAGHRAAQEWLTVYRAEHPPKPAAQPTAPPTTAPVCTPAEQDAFREYMADAYFRIVSAAIRKRDPNHLILGSRFHGGELKYPDIFKSAGKYCDVISVNYYLVWTPNPKQLTDWTAWSGRPLLITEWYAKGADSGLPNLSGAGFTVPTQRDRGRFYQNFTLGLLQSKNVVGWHWFKFMDNDPKDLSTDPSNRDSNKGIVTIDHKPYNDLADLMRELNRVAYPLTEYFDKRN